MLNVAKQTLTTVKTELGHIDGSDKLIRKIESEIKFLTHSPDSPSSNITSIVEIVKVALKHKENLIHLLKPVELPKIHNSGTRDKIITNHDQPQQMDLIVEEENEKCFDKKQLVWMKVIARKGLSLHEHVMGRSDSKNRNVVEQAIDISKLASKCSHNHSSIKVIFNLNRGVTSCIKSFLESKLNIKVNADEVHDDPYPEDVELLEDEYYGETLTPVPEFYDFQEETVNLDVTTMLTLCSNLSNVDNSRFPWHKTSYKLIAEQAGWELAKKALPIIDNYLKNKKIVVCRTAHQDFMDIVSKVGGEAERERAEQLLARIKIIDDNASNTSLMLPTSQRMSDRSVIIFGTGDFHKIATVTANVGFVRAASQNGVNFCVLKHEPRVLSEEKQKLSFPDV